MTAHQSVEAAAMADGVMEHLGPLALMHGYISPIDAFELGWKARAELTRTQVVEVGDTKLPTNLNDLARQAGLPMSWLDKGLSTTWRELEAFAALILATSGVTAPAQAEQPAPVYWAIGSSTGSLSNYAYPNQRTAQQIADCSSQPAPLIPLYAHPPAQPKDTAPVPHSGVLQEIFEKRFPKSAQFIRAVDGYIEKPLSAWNVNDYNHKFSVWKAGFFDGRATPIEQGDAKDAERYQNLRNWVGGMNSDVLQSAMIKAGFISTAPTALEFDLVIDAAILASKPADGGAAT